MASTTLELDVRSEISLKSRPEILDGYLCRAPVCHALFRAAETRELSLHTLRRPVLDLGCGSGEFAAVSTERQIDVGLDSCPARLDMARRTNRYKRLVEGDARSLPFPEESFETVVSVSVLEHITEPAAVLGEAARVLRPGGRLLATIVLPDLHRQLCFSWLFRKLCLGKLATLYERFHAGCFGHRTLLDQHTWETLARTNGLKVLQSRRVVSPAVAWWWDLLLCLAVPYRLCGRFGPALVWHPGWFRQRLSKWARGILDDDDAGGGVLFLVAEKVEEIPE